MRRIAITVQKHNGNGFYVVGLQFIDNTVQRAFIEWLMHRAIRLDTLGNTVTPLPRNQQRTLFSPQRINIATNVSTNLQYIAKAMRCNQRTTW